MTSSRPTAIVSGTTASSSAINTALGIAGGFYVVSQLAPSGVASISANSVFTSAAWAYRIIGDVSCSTGGSLNFNLRASGADISTAASYKTNGSVLNGGAVGAWQYSTTYWQIASSGAESISFDIMLYRPFETAVTRATWLAGNGTSLNQWAAAGSQTTATTADGFTIGITGGTFTGDIAIHAVRGDK